MVGERALWRFKLQLKEEAAGFLNAFVLFNLTWNYIESLFCLFMLTDFARVRDLSIHENELTIDDDGTVNGFVDSLRKIL